MKKIFILSVLIAAACHLCAQKSKAIPQNLTGKDLSQQYLKKSRDQKAGALILMAGGVALGALGGFSTMSFVFPKDDNSGAYTMIGIGVVSFLCSIPLFISASKNKMRAMMVIKTQPINVPTYISQRQTSIGLLIPLGR